MIGSDMLDKCAYCDFQAAGFMAYGPDDVEGLCPNHLQLAAQMHQDLTIAMNFIAPVRERG